MLQTQFHLGGLLQSLMPRLPGMLGGMQGPMPGLPQGPQGQQPPQGPMQAPPPPQPSQRPTPLQNLLGVDPTRMSPEAARQRQSLALIQAGAQLADDPGNFAGAVGRAVMTGRESVEQQAKKAQRESMLKRLGQLSPKELERGFQMALSTGDLETAKLIQQMIASQRASVAAADKRYTLSASPGSSQELVDAEGNVIRRIEGGPALPPNQIIREVMMPDGSVQSVAINPRSLEQTPIAGNPVPDVDQRQATVFAAQAVQANEMFDALEERGFEPGIVSEIATDMPRSAQVLLNQFVSDDQQQFNAARDQITESFLRPVTGAVINDSETGRAIRMMVPLPGDGPETLAAKRARRKLWMEAMAYRSGNPRRFDSATEAMDEVFGEGEGAISYNIEDYMQSRRGGGNQ